MCESTLDTMEKTLTVLEDYSIAYLMRMENYRGVECAIRDGVLLPVDHMNRLLAIFAHDLCQDTKYAVTILKLLSSILKSEKMGAHSHHNGLVDTASAIMAILSKTAPLHKVQSLQTLCTDVLLTYPESVYEELGITHRADVLVLADQYVSSANVENDIRTMILQVILKVLQALKPELRDLLVKDGIPVWFSRIVPAIFTMKAPAKEISLDIMEIVVKHLTKMDYGDHPQWIALFRNISSPDKYPALLVAMLKSGDPQWYRAWCCIVKLLGIRLHKSATLINSLLAVLENAFKMQSVERCRAFYCWRLLIDNFSLNMDQFFSHRRIKLLLIPLMVNNAKEEQSASSKFDTWWHLLCLLQPKIEEYMDSIVVPFIHFCFGHMKYKEGHTASVIPGLTFPTVKCQVVDALIECIGHTYCTRECLTQTIELLEGAIVNPQTIVTHTSLWMHAVKQTTVLISEMETDNKQPKIKCLYWSLINVMIAVDDKKHQEILFQEFKKMLSEVVLISQDSHAVADLFFNILGPYLINEKSHLSVLDNQYRGSTETNLQYFFELLLCPSFKDFYSPGHASSLEKLQILTNAGVQKSADAFSKWLLQALNTDEEFVQHSLVWWTSLVRSIVHRDCDIMANTVRDIFIWPITKMEYFTETNTAAPAVWSELYMKINNMLKTETQMPLDILNIFMVHYRDNPVHNLYAIHVLPQTMKSILENDPNNLRVLAKELDTMERLSKSIAITFANDEELGRKNLNVMYDFLDRAISGISSEMRHMKVVRNVVQSALHISKVVLTSSSVSQDDKEKNILRLIKTLQEIISKEDDHVDNLIKDLLSQCLKSNIESVKKAATDRHPSQKMSEEDRFCCEKTSSNSGVAISPKSKPILIKAKNMGKIVKKVSVGKEEFVVVKSNWKFNPHKLTEHQKEMMTKKREDIPALYQDLSQSQDELKIKSWKMPTYQSDSQDTTSLSNSLDKGENAMSNVSNILKDIPNREICPTVMKTILKEDETMVTTNATCKENANIEKTPKSIKNISLKSPRVSIKDKINMNVQNLLSSLSPSGPASTLPVTKVVNAGSPTRYNNIVRDPMSAPPKIDSDRPSRTKRKPKKLEGDFEILALVKRKRNSLDTMPSEITTEQSVGSVPNELISQDMIIVSMNSNLSKSVEKEQNVEKHKLTNELRADPVANERATNETNVSSLITTVTCIEKTEQTTNSLNASNGTLSNIRSVDNDKTFPGNEALVITVPSENNSNSVCTPKPKCKQKLDGSVSPSVETVENVDSSETPHNKPKPKSKQNGSVKAQTTKKKNRLELQLAIDMVEGHPLLSQNEEPRSTRKARQQNDSQIRKTEKTEKNKSISETPKHKNSTTSKANKHDMLSQTNGNGENRHFEVDAVSKLSSGASDIKIDLLNSEDFIESSQESPVSTPKIAIKSSRRSNNYSNKTNTMNKIRHKESNSNSECECDTGCASTLSTIIGKQNHCSPSGTVDDQVLECNNADAGSKSDDLKECEDNETSFNRDDDILTRGDNDETNISSNKSIENMNVEDVASMDTQPVQYLTGNISDVDVFLNENKAHVSNINLSFETNSIKNFNEGAIVGMYNEPFVSKLEAPKPKAHLNDVLIIGDNSVVPVQEIINLDSYSETIAEADTEPVQSSFFDTQKHDGTIIQSDSKRHTTVANDETEFDHDTTINSCCSPLRDERRRESDFLNNTFDISPIKVVSPSKHIVSPSADDSSNSNDYLIIPLNSPEPTECISPEMFTNDKVSPDKQEQSPPRASTSTSTGSPSSLSLKKNRSQMKVSGRGAQMLGLCHPSSLFPEKSEEDRTPTLARRNLGVAYGQSVDNELQPDHTHVENFLSFKKELPAASSSPSGPILKRKLCEISDEVVQSPASKRKRVSFHDPPVSTTVSVHKYIDETLRSPQQKSKERKAKQMTSKKRLEMLHTEPADLPKSSVTPHVSTTSKETLSPTKTVDDIPIDTQIDSLPDTPAAVINTKEQLNNTEPIYSDLVDCVDPIANIVGELSTESMKDIFLKELIDVSTVGHFARLTELEVSRLNIRCPKIETAKTVLSKYHSEEKVNNKSLDVSHMQIQTESGEDFLWSILKDWSNKQVIDVCLEKRDGFIEEFTCAITPDMKHKIAEELPTETLCHMVCERLQREPETRDAMIERLAKEHTQPLLDKVVCEAGIQTVLERVGLDSIQEYLLSKLNLTELVRFCSTTMQTKIVSE